MNTPPGVQDTSLTRPSEGPPTALPRRAANFPTTAQFAPKPVYEVVTRLYNFLGALVGILVLSPLLLVIAAAVKLTSSGPALYRGARVGRDERPFDIFKFRTMHVGAEQKIGQRLVQQSEDHFTPIGRFLRKYRLDELAQLLNVLNGDMNLVGPRPVRPIFLEEHKRKVPGYTRRFSVRPGITGKAQVRGGYYTSARHKLFYEVLYIKHRTIGMDLQLIVLTFLRVMNKVFTTGFLVAWLLLAVLVLPAEVQRELSLPIGSVSVNPLYAMPVVIALWHLLRRDVIDKRMYALRSPVDLPLLGFLAVTALLVPLSRFPLEALKGLGWFLCNGAVVFYVVLNSRLVSERRSTLVNTLVLGTSIAGISATSTVLGQMLLTGEYVPPPARSNTALVLSALVVLATPLAFARLRQTRTSLRRVLYLASCVVLIGTALVAWRKAGLSCLAVAICLYLVRTRPRLSLAFAGAYAAIVIAFGFANDPRYAFNNIGAEIRSDYAQQLQVVEAVRPERLLLGVGARVLPLHAQTSENLRPGKNRPRLRIGTAENTWLSLFADHGLVGFSFFVVFFVGALGIMWRATPRVADPSARDDLWATTCGLVGFALLMWSDDLFYRLPTFVLFWSMMGLGLGTALMHGPGPRTYYRLVHYRHRL
jgi:lipopolysaccharide/colanic/teichoic acid biosynthesis glycosyltransferase